MNEEMVNAAYELQKAARNYRELYEKQNPKMPVIWIKNENTGEGVFISDSYNTELMKKILIECRNKSLFR